MSFFIYYFIFSGILLLIVALFLTSLLVGDAIKASSEGQKISLDFFVQRIDFWDEAFTSFGQRLAKKIVDKVDRRKVSA